MYAIDIDRFKDSNGDGIGDFAGLTSEIDYLADLGVTCLWLLPFFPSPERDNGYDIADYYAVNERVGSFEDFVTFLHKAGERGMRVIVDLVVNHTSDQHPWFQAARRDAGSIYRAYYTWTDAPPPTPPGKGSIFPGQENSVWTYDPIAGAYYYHRFYHFQPDLNFRNELVRDEIKRILDFWLSFGISGFRVDAASHMIESNPEDGYEGEDRHDILKEIHAHVAGRKPEAILIGEADVPTEKLVAYMGDGDELTMLFNFVLNNYFYLAMARKDARPLIEILRQLPAIPDSCTWANFLRNLDEVDLERLTDKDRKEIYAQFAPEQNMRIYDRGLRRRLAPILGGDRKRLEFSYSLLFALPGTPVIVYGDEIGMGEDLEREGRWAVRSPMQWSAEKNAGFSDAPRSELVQRVIDFGPFSYKNVNVADERKDPDSLWAHIRRMIRVRRQCQEIGVGNSHIMDIDTPYVLALRYAYKDGLVISLHNFTPEPQRIVLDMRDQLGRRMEGLLREGILSIQEQGQLEVEMEPYGYQWYRVTGEREQGEV